MKKTFWKYIAIIASVILADFITKGFLLYLLTHSVPLYAPSQTGVRYIITQVCGIFDIVFTWNPGTAFSLFRSLGDTAPLVIIVITGFIIGCLGYYLFTRAQKYERVPLALIVGGAIGNLIDRVRFGAVVDFLDFHIGGYHWPAFNVADICICVGVALYILNWIIARRKCLNSAKDK